MNPIAVYFLARLAVFVVVLAVLVLAGARGVLAVGGAALISLMLSYLLLRKLRYNATNRVQTRVETRIQRKADKRGDTPE